MTKNAATGVSGAVERDAHELRRAVFVNTLGNALKLAMPLLLALATNAYGVTRWGIYVAAQSVVMIVLRVALLGLDKAILWWTAGRERAQGAAAVMPAMLLAAGSAALVALATAYLGPLAIETLAREAVHSPERMAAQTHALRIMLVGLVPFAMTDVLLNAAMGQRRMAPQVWIRDTFAPVATIALSVAFFYAGMHESGLAWGFTCAHLIALPLAWVAYKGIYSAAPVRAELPRALVKYAGPLWLTEIVNSFLLRVDVLVLSLFVDASLVGVWGIVSQFGNAMRSIRRAFDPVVTALSANIATHHDPVRLREAYSYATQLISLTQFPIFIFLIASADLILPLYGDGFERGVWPLVILSAFWLVNGASGLAGIVVSGYGRSQLILFNVVVGLAAQVALLYWLVPLHGLSGAAFAVGGAYCIQNVLQLIEMRVITGSLNYSTRVLQPLRPGLSAIALGAAVWWLAAQLGSGASAQTLRIAALGVFALVYGAVTFVDYRAGRLAVSVSAGS